MEQNIIKFCLERGVLLDKEIYSMLSGFSEEAAKEIIEKISFLKEKMITKSFFVNNVDRISEMIKDETLIEKIKINFGMSVEISREKFLLKQEKAEEKKEVEVGTGNLKIISSSTNNTKKLSPKDFINYFRRRFVEMKSILQERKELEGLTSINKINGQRQAFSIIGIVYNKRVTKNKNILLELEDLTGKITILVNKNKTEVYEKAKNVLFDDVVGVKGVGNREIVFTSDIIYPDSFLPEKKAIERDEAAAFISDVHVGSLNFLEEKFLRFINWLNGEEGDEKQRKEARKIKYLLITGDCVDGVGVFPGQEELLDIKDIKEQYEKLGELLGKIRKDVKIIICPGQHDAVRIAEPQPFIGKNYAPSLYDLENVILVSNPALLEIKNKEKGIKILMYHGASMNSFVNEIENLRVGKAHNNPSKVVKEILKRRHLAPIHSSVTYVPYEEHDPLLIKEIPDIIATADFHKPDVDLYNNVLIICSSCWQSITSFEEKVGNNPEPCKVPVLNLKTREIKILDFS